MKRASPQKNRERSANDQRNTKVWDDFVRLFHWSLVALMLALVFSAHTGKQEIHQFLGFSLTAIVIARIYWGFAGSDHARFRSFLTSPLAALRYLNQIIKGHPDRYLGHNPAGGWMVLVLLATLTVLLGTGIALQATLEFSGPFVGLLFHVDDHAVHQLFLLHDKSMTVLYLLVPLHLLGVFLASRQHGENLVSAMISGYKPTKTER